MKILKIQHPILDDSRITYGFFTRSGGTSKSLMTLSIVALTMKMLQLMLKKI